MKITEVEEPKRSRENWEPLYRKAVANPGKWFEVVSHEVSPSTVKNIALQTRRGERFAAMASEHGGKFDATTRKNSDGYTALLIVFREA